MVLRGGHGFGLAASPLTRFSRDMNECFYGTCTATSFRQTFSLTPPPRNQCSWPTRHMHRGSHEKSPFGLTNDHETLRLNKRLPSQNPPKVFGFRFGLTASHLSLRMSCQRNANKEWLKDGAWLGGRIACRRGGDGVIPTTSGQCASTKSIAKGAPVPIRSDDADAKIQPW